jgi:hypothetical protein
MLDVADELLIRHAQAGIDLLLLLLRLLWMVGLEVRGVGLLLVKIGCGGIVHSGEERTLLRVDEVRSRCIRRCVPRAPDAELLAEIEVAALISTLLLLSVLDRFALEGGLGFGLRLLERLVRAGISRVLGVLTHLFGHRRIDLAVVGMNRMVLLLRVLGGVRIHAGHG